LLPEQLGNSAHGGRAPHDDEQRFARAARAAEQALRKRATSMP